jgi:hypothetical protein
MLDCLSRQFLILQNENVLVPPVVEEVWHCDALFYQQSLRPIRGASPPFLHYTASW